MKDASETNYWMLVRVNSLKRVDTNCLFFFPSSYCFLFLVVLSPKRVVRDPEG